MGKILDDLDVEYTVGIDEAAFYGPKLDIQYKNVFGKEDTLVTIQIDHAAGGASSAWSTPTADGQKKTPYIIHRTSLGCYERTLAYLIEAFRRGPAPVADAGPRSRSCPSRTGPTTTRRTWSPSSPPPGFVLEADQRSEKLGYKIREAQMQKIPYMLVVGDRDMENGTRPRPAPAAAATWER